jgi:hypothetical protein
MCACMYVGFPNVHVCSEKLMSCTSPIFPFIPQHDENIIELPMKTNRRKDNMSGSATVGHLGLPSRLIGFSNSAVTFAISLHRRVFANI